MPEPITTSIFLAAKTYKSALALSKVSAGVQVTAAKATIASYQANGISGAVSTLGQYGSLASAALFVEKHGEKIFNAMLQSSGNRRSHMGGR